VKNIQKQPPERLRGLLLETEDYGFEVCGKRFHNITGIAAMTSSSLVGSTNTRTVDSGVDNSPALPRINFC
jgi:hypothetical protein